MRLTRVTLSGFKTFADRTDFRLEGGLAAVVGPNGCGKSNLVDAILWGLGEGSARQLRAGSSHDVLFTGSPARRAVGFAEVTLVFDNAAGTLPVASSEVSVARRLNRNGESAYRINDRVVRLKDVHDLLADSGVGRSGYAIVGQKEIDAALSAGADERRAWIDEAAGAQRYRVRKQEARRRLDQAREHLARITDILRELEAQREPLRAEAEAARRYRELKDALRDVEVGIRIRELGDAERAIAESVQRSETTRRAIDAAETEATHAEQAAETGAQELRSAEAAWSAAVNAKAKAERERDLADHELRLLQERFHSAEAARQDRRSRAEAIAAELEEAALELAAATDSRRTAEADAQALKDQLQEVDAQAAAARERRASIEKEIRAAKQAEEARVRVEASVAQRAARAERVRRELDEWTTSLPGLLGELRAAEEEVERHRTAVAEATEALRHFDAEMERRRVSELERARNRQARETEIAAWDARKRGIEATLEAWEGMAQGSRAVLEAAKRGELAGSFVAVGRSFTAPADLAKAIETALGPAVSDLIVEDPADAKRAIDWLNHHRAGRATFQPIRLMRPNRVGPELAAVLREDGVIGRAADAVKARNGFRPVIESLLGRVVIVHDLDVALRLAKSPGWSRLVTLSGEVQHASGSVTGGQTGRSGTGWIQREAEVRELAECISAARAELDATQEPATPSPDRTPLAHALAEAESERQDQEVLAAKIREEHRAAVRAEARLRAELAELGESPERAPMAVDISALERMRDSLLADDAGGSADASQLSLRIQEAERRMLAETNRALGAAKREELLRRELTQIEQRNHDIGASANAWKAQQAAAQNRRREAQEGIAEASAEVEQRETAKVELLRELEQARERSRRGREEARALAQTLSALEVQRVRAETRRAHAAERLLDEYGIPSDEALRREQEVVIPADAAATESRLRREIKGMGEVNLGAIDAFARLSERYEELDTQQRDVLGGIAEVESTLKELDGTIRERFTETLTRVNQAFSERFRALFDGGEAEISLTDPDEVLDSGLEITVTLPGKRRQRLALLSGGERSLCAMAFLFALLDVKPSPLVVLDEVDAPLDGRNVERFAQLLREFAQRMQVIVITHNMVTIEAADVWLGVTMEEPGVSRLLPTRVPTPV
jgi:chromosome segregation protein